MIERLAREERTVVIYEAARRLGDTLTEIASSFGAERLAAVAREISKTFEETIRGTVAELAERFQREPALGEVTIVVEGAPPGVAKSPSDDASAGASDSITVEALRDAGLSLKDASAVVARLRGRSRREVYRDALHRAERDR
jgi:16S rRNA (cytidine1402-2'-O)-methyltransferase